MIGSSTYQVSQSPAEYPTRNGLHSVTVECCDDGSYVLHMRLCRKVRVGKRREQQRHRFGVRLSDATGRVYCIKARVVDGGCAIRCKFTLEKVADPYLVRLVSVNEQPDACSHALSLACDTAPLSGFDPRFVEVQVWLSGRPIARRDFMPPRLELRAVGIDPEINYLAKDYAGFRQLMFDRLRLTMPEWRERHAADMGVMLVELLAYVGDYLSYYQDAVATEAYLGTARRRISVRRHTRLVDYRLHEGSSSRTLMHVLVNGSPEVAAGDLAFISRGQLEPRFLQDEVVDSSALPDDWEEQVEIFEPLLVMSPSKPDSGRAPRAPKFWEQHSSEANQAPTLRARDELKLQFYATHNAIHFHYDRDVAEVWLPSGTRCARLRGTLSTPQRQATFDNFPQLYLKPGDLLILAEVKGPTTDNESDADPNHRQAVRLTNVFEETDFVTGNSVVVVEWHPDDALRFPLCLRAKRTQLFDQTLTPCGNTCPPVDDVSLAWGNIVLVDRGRTLDWKCLGKVETESLAPQCPPRCSFDRLPLPKPFRPQLEQSGLVFSVPCPAEASASAMLVPRSEEALPQIELIGLQREVNSLLIADRLPDWLSGKQSAPADFVQTDSSRAVWGLIAQDLEEELGSMALSEQVSLPDILTRARKSVAWRPEYDLVDRGANERVFVVEMDDERCAHLRFGDDRLGRRPPTGMQFMARYRVIGKGDGRFGADGIDRLVFRKRMNTDILSVTNPLPTQGGAAPQSLNEAKLEAPTMWRRRQQRAVVAEDYEQLVQRQFDRDIQGAHATIRWCGTYSLVHVLLDIRSTATLTADQLKIRVTKYLERYRRLGHRVQVDVGIDVPIDLVLLACVKPGYFRADTRQALIDVLGNRELEDGRKGLFHRDRILLGQPIYVSRIVAEAKTVREVENVKVERLARLDNPNFNATETGVLEFGRLEAALLDTSRDPRSTPVSGTRHNPCEPRSGRLCLHLEGGR